jgi:hypothetical protein
MQNFKNIHINFESVVGKEVYERIKENEKEIYDIVTFVNKI